MLLQLLQRLPGYTVAMLEQEPAQRIQRWLHVFELEAQKAARDAEAAKRKNRRGR